MTDHDLLAIGFGLTVADPATTWAPYLTMSKGWSLVALAFTRELARVSCCAA